MSAEYQANRLLDAVADKVDDIDAYADENVRSGGYFFTFTHRDRHYEVEIVEVTQR